MEPDTEPLRCIYNARTQSWYELHEVGTNVFRVYVRTGGQIVSHEEFVGNEGPNPWSRAWEASRMYG